MKQKNMTPHTTTAITSRLRTWRVTTLNTLLIVTSIAAAPIILFVIIEAIHNPEQWPAAWAFIAIYLFIVGLTIFRRLGFHLRAWGLLLLVYAAAVLAFARGGLAGDGRVYLLALPLLAMILIDLRSGLAMAALSLLTFAGFAATARLGWMAEWLVRQENTLLLSDWVAGGIAFLLTLAGVMAIQWRFNQFQRAIAGENLSLYKESDELREFNENIVQGMDEGILIADTTGRIMFVNPKTADLLGYAAEDLIGQPWTGIVAPEHIAAVEEEMGGQPRSIARRYETALLTHEGRRVPVIVSARPLSDEGRFTGVLSVFTDITAHKRAEEKLREYRDRLEDMVEQRSTELIKANEQLQREVAEREYAEGELRQRNRELAMLNRAGRAFSSTLDVDQVLVTVLEEVRRLLGVIACSIWLTDPKTDELVCRQAAGPQSETVRGWRLPPGKGLAGWVARSGESLIVPDIQANGRYFDEVDQQTNLGLRSILSVPLRAKDSVIGVLQATDTEVNSFTTADLTLLEPLVASAAVAIDNARLVEMLRQRTDELEARNEELDTFAHTAAHDLKNPLAHIVGFAEVLRGSHSAMPDEETRRYLHRIAQNGRKMGKIIDELLLLAGVRQMKVRIGPLDMAPIVAEARQRLAPTIEELRGEVTLPETWPVALGYGPWIEEVWVNYLGNALKYGGRPPRVELGYSIVNSLPEESQSKMARFWVHDNGPGIAPEEQARLFTPFTRLNQTNAQGYGLGLSIARRIVEKLGGRVEVESEAGNGSTFTFTLPLYTDH